MPPNYYAIFTTLGLEALASAQASGIPLVFTHVAVGDGNGSPITPSVGMTALVHETARVSVNYVSLVASEPTTVRVEGLIPAATGGFTIREAGLFNQAGQLLVIASYPPIYKPEPSDGVTAEEYIRILLVYEAVDAIALTVDPSVVIATREYVDQEDEQLEDRIEYLESVALRFDLGDGSDGAAVLDGTNTYSWASKSGSTYTLTRAPMLTDLTLYSGITLKRAGFPLRGTGTYTTQTGAIDSHDGSPGGAGSGSSGAGGAGAVAGEFLAAGAGGGAGDTTNGTAGAAVINSVGGAGGAGGSLPAVGTGGAGGTATPPIAGLGSPRTFRALIEGYLIGNSSGATLAGLTGGGGGGGGVGASGDTLYGGGGGGGGGVSATAFQSIVNNGTIRAKGGAGGNGDNSGPFSASGGGGGGGGKVGIACASYSGAGTIDVSGGAGGNVGNSGSSGTTPAAGSTGETEILYAAGDPSAPHVEENVAIFSNVDHVDVVFPNGWAYQVATGLDGYRIEMSPPVLYGPSGYGDVGISIINKTLNGFTIQLTDVIQGEVNWKTKGY